MTTKASAPSSSTLEVLRSLWPLYLAYALSQLGNWMFRAGAVYEIFDKQGGAGSLLGWTIMCVYVPIMIGGKWLAPLSDRFRSVPLLIVLDIICSLLLIPLLIWADMGDSSQVIIALGVIIGLSFLNPLFTAAQSSMFRRLKTQQVVPAMSLLSNITWATHIVGTMFGSLLLILLSFRIIVLIDIFSFVLSFGILALWLRPQVPSIAGDALKEPESSPPSLSAVKVKWILLVSVFFLNLGAGVINLFPAAAARSIYHMDQAGLSLFYLVNGISAFAGTMLIGRLRKKIADFQLLAASSLLIAVSLFAMSWFPSLSFSIVASSSMLLFGQIFGVVAHSFLLTSHRPEQAGRTSGLFMSCTFLGVAVNAALFALFFKTVQTEPFSLFMQACGGFSLISFIIITVHELKKRQSRPSKYDAETQNISK
ncbi:MFS transporter [Paenibacillus alba]|uniref:MFS transporter n=1 Tax=Paenibacillus alba TaxID=1197127 RepID=A0ABU6FX86_9BACL|nr:MFS transporter [Paenibacillus alba]MEC0226519.1 MFS transporter [Paenibacillus alba]